MYSFTWIYSMETQIPESKFTPLTMINVIIFKIFTTFHSLDQGFWPGNRWYFLGEYNTHLISFY